MKDFTIRLIKPEDNEAIAQIIRKTLIEYNSAIPGTAFFDNSLDNLYEVYQADKTVYYVAEYNGKVVGGAGIGKLETVPDTFCELQKMYLLPEARGKGIGAALMQVCLEFARKSGYQKCYLESFDYMNAAVNMYKKFGFKLRKSPLGNTGHSACNVWMEADLSSF